MNKQNMRINIVNYNILIHVKGFTRITSMILNTRFRDVSPMRPSEIA